MLPLRDCWQVPPGDLGPLGSNVGERERERVQRPRHERETSVLLAIKVHLFLRFQSLIKLTISMRDDEV